MSRTRARPRTVRSFGAHRVGRVRFQSAATASSSRVDVGLVGVGGDAGSDGATVDVDAIAVHQLDGVVIAVPDGDLEGGKGAGDLVRGVAVDEECQRRCPVGRIVRTEDADVRHRQQAVEQSR